MWAGQGVPHVVWWHPDLWFVTPHLQSFVECLSWGLSASWDRGDTVPAVVVVPVHDTVMPRAGVYLFVALG